VDSFGLISTQKVWLLILGVIIALVGLVMLTDRSLRVGASILVFSYTFYSGVVVYKKGLQCCLLNVGRERIIYDSEWKSTY
jgi:hypothetical protein